MHIVQILLQVLIGAIVPLYFLVRRLRPNLRSFRRWFIAADARWDQANADAKCDARKLPRRAIDIRRAIPDKYCDLQYAIPLGLLVWAIHVYFVFFSFDIRTYATIAVVWALTPWLRNAWLTSQAVRLEQRLAPVRIKRMQTKIRRTAYDLSDYANDPDAGVRAEAAGFIALLNSLAGESDLDTICHALSPAVSEFVERHRTSAFGRTREHAHREEQLRSMYYLVNELFNRLLNAHQPHTRGLRATLRHHYRWGFELDRSKWRKALGSR